MTDTAARARAFVETMEARDWAAWERLLSAGVVYRIPQTREQIRGRDAYLRFNETFPGEWHLQPTVVIGDADRAVVWFLWTDERGSGDAQVFLEFGADGLITSVTDFWPDPYDPPARVGGPLERY